MNATHNTVRVFIASTFPPSRCLRRTSRDMHAERDHLVTVVFPELRERVEKVGLEFFGGANRVANVAKGIDLIPSQTYRLADCFG